MNLLIVVLVGIACLAVVVLLAVGMILDARAREARMERHRLNNPVREQR